MQNFGSRSFSQFEFSPYLRPEICPYIYREWCDGATCELRHAEDDGRKAPFSAAFDNHDYVSDDFARYLREWVCPWISAAKCNDQSCDLDHAPVQKYSWSETNVDDNEMCNMY